MVKHGEVFILKEVNGREHAQSERDKARAQLEKAQDALHELEQGLKVTSEKGTPQGPCDWDRDVSGPSP